MLKKRSTTSASKQALIADYTSLSSPTNSHRISTSSSIFSSQKSVLSPTSILDPKPFSPVKRNPFWSDPVLKTRKSPISGTKNDDPGPKKVGLGIVDSLTDEIPEPDFSKPKNGKVLFGSKLRIQIPPLPQSSIPSPTQSPISPGDFGIKTRNSHLGSFSPIPVRKSPFGCGIEKPKSPDEMELLEEYTCVISRGANPRTTHIFDDCVVESCCGVGVKSANKRKENGRELFGNRSMSYPSESFLSFCYTCKKNLGQGKDIYMYRGEKGFCSSECRHKEMMLEEEVEKSCV